MPIVPARRRTTSTAMRNSAGTIMDRSELYRVMSWLSPAYPVGAFSYSHGLEWLVETGAISDAATLQCWLGDILIRGSGRNDAILFAHAHGAVLYGNLKALCEVAEYANALAASAERRLETNAQGAAFSEITCKTWGSPSLAQLLSLYPKTISYPVAVAAAAADHGVALAPALEAYIHAFTANLVSAGVRLIPLGHTAGQRVLMQLESAVADTVAQGLAGNLSQLSNITIMAEIAAMKHETQYTRLFRS
ncbi:MAG TPA: urease accessory protein UreF [Micropepsaceae bacterium]|nr:urease accessory protein UreF [Micropepsaceae bacterium]